MKLSIAELLTDADVSAISVTENHPLSLERVIEKTISGVNSITPARARKRPSRLLIAAVITALMATTVWATPIGDYFEYIMREYPSHIIVVEYQVRDDGQIIYPDEPEKPDLGISLSVSDISPAGLKLTYFLDKASDAEVSIITSYFFLDIQTENNWKVVPAHNTEQLQESWLNVSEVPNTIYIDWSATHGELSPGTYRIRHAFEFARSDGVFSVYFIDAEFVIEG